jgi:peptidoglycan hydrolase CwlO-like protein
VNVTITLATIGQILAIVTALGAIWATQHQRRLIAVKEGERNEQIKALQNKIDVMEADQRDLEKKSHCTDVDLGKINEKIDTLTDMIREIKDRIDKIAPPTVRERAEREARN